MHQKNVKPPFKITPMKRLKINTFLVAIVAALLLPQFTKGNDGRPISNLHKMYPILIRNCTDTLPTTKQTAAANNENQVDEVIKVVPKARRQAIPIPVGVQVKPIILIKPRIIKPIIKILH